MTIAMADFRAQRDEIRKDLEAAEKRVFERGWFVLGPEVEAFEAQWAAYCGVKHAITVANGTDALMLSLRALGVGPGDEVITTPTSAIATAVAITHAGAKPVFADVDPRTLLLDLASVERAITPRTRAIVPVHLYGNPLDVQTYRSFADERGLFLLEDACQAHGATSAGARVGSVGHAGAFSFYPTKNLGAFGDGGVVVTQDDALASRLRLLRNYGQVVQYQHESIGYNSRLDEIQAAYLGAKLPHLERWTEKRRAHAALYRRALEGVVECVAESGAGRHVYHQFVIRVPHRDQVQRSLDSAGIKTQVHYPVPIHQSGAYQAVRASLPHAEKAASEILSLPCHPHLSSEQVRHVAEAVRVAVGTSEV